MHPGQFSPKALSVAIGRHDDFVEALITGLVRPTPELLGVLDELATPLAQRGCLPIGEEWLAMPTGPGSLAHSLRNRYAITEVPDVRQGEFSGSSYLEFCKRHQAFQIHALLRAFDRDDKELYQVVGGLRASGFHELREWTYDHRRLSVWRWNPLRFAPPPGRLCIDSVYKREPEPTKAARVGRKPRVPLHELMERFQDEYREQVSNYLKDKRKAGVRQRELQSKLLAPNLDELPTRRRAINMLLGENEFTYHARKRMYVYNPIEPDKAK